MSRQRKKQEGRSFMAVFLLLIVIVFLLARFSLVRKPPSDIVIPRSVDVVVVGSGLTGTLAVLAAAEASADVLYINTSNEDASEYPPYLPVFWAAATPYQLEFENEYIPETMANDIYSRGGSTGNFAQILTVSLQSAQSLQWVEGMTSITFSAVTADQLGLHRSTQADSLAVVVQETEERVQGFISEEENLQPIRLLMQGGRVSGLLVRAGDGSEVEVSARAVILADGGNASQPQLNVLPRLEGGHNGVGLQLAQSIGAHVEGLAQIVLQAVLLPHGSSVTTLDLEDTILFNKLGELTHQEGTLAATIEGAGGQLFVVAAKGHPLTKQIATQEVEDLKTLAAVLKTKEELLPSQIEFLQEPYQVAILGVVALTPGGLTVNQEYSVIGKNGPIAGLFAAGELTAGLHGDKAIRELFLTEAIVSAHIAGSKAASFAQR
ncbi:MAG: FAD-binding protein [Firmicutes bacterium]|nr:FAD-binding protein [Bacillota bacterium]